MQWAILIYWIQTQLKGDLRVSTQLIKRQIITTNSWSQLPFLVRVLHTMCESILSVHSADIVTTKKKFLVFWAEQNSDHNNFFFLLTIWTEFPPEFYSNSHCESWGSWLQLMVIVLDRYIQVLFYLSTWLWADFKGSFKLSPLCSGKYCSRSLWSPSSIPLSTCSAFNYKIICDTW